MITIFQGSVVTQTMMLGGLSMHHPVVNFL